MARILDLDRKYQILIIIFISIFVALIALAITISNIQFTDKPEGSVAVVLNDGDLVINYVDGNQIVVGDGKTKNYAITLTNSSKNNIYYSIGFKDTNHDARVIVLDDEGNEISALEESVSSKKAINLYSIAGGETVRYTLKITANKGTFKGELIVTNESLTTQTFSDILLLNNLVVTSKTRIGSEVALDNEGLLSIQDNLGTSYYFRGDVKNNYLKMNDLYFRVVRINGDETVRVVLDGVLNDTVPYNGWDRGEEQPLEEMARIDKASIQETLNNWLNDKLGNYQNYLVDGYFCTETSFKDKNGVRISSSYERIFEDEAPDLICENSTYKSKVGLLSADEIVLAGAYKNTPNEKYYLYNESIKGNYLTSSSYNINSSDVISMMNVLSDGSLGEGVLVTTASYVRPVVNISIQAKLKGEGTQENPYVIVS